MTRILKNLFIQLGEWVTRFKSKQPDLFNRARWKIAALYLLIGVVISVVFDYILVDNILKNTLIRLTLNESDLAAKAFHEIKTQLWIARIIKLILFSISAYFLAGYVLKPIRQSADLQRRFISMVSHELRTPLTIKKNASEIALRKADNLTKEEAVTILRSNLEETDRIIDIINFLLSYSNLESEKSNLMMVNVSLKKVSENVIELMKKKSDTARVNLSLNAKIEGLVKGNRTALEEMLTNLVRNAIDYTPDGGSVEVKIEDMEENKVCVSVIDTGVGISKADLPNLFEPFYRGNEQALHGNKNGLGLGLNIVKGIVHMHKASISVGANREGGTTFKVSFKRAIIDKTIENM